jgi:hypothetical protein
MCTVSMVTDHYLDKWQPHFQTLPPTWQVPPLGRLGISRDEFDALRREVEELKSLLVRAKAYDERTGQPDCENDEKMETVRKIAALVGINLDDVIGKAKEAGR